MYMSVPPELLQIASWIAWAVIVVFTFTLLAVYLGHWAGGFLERYL